MVAGMAVDADIIIIGGGPCRLVLANELGRRGIAALLVATRKTTSPYPQANATQARWSITAASASCGGCASQAAGRLPDRCRLFHPATPSSPASSYPPQDAPVDPRHVGIVECRRAAASLLAILLSASCATRPIASERPICASAGVLDFADHGDHIEEESVASRRTARGGLHRALSRRLRRSAQRDPPPASALFMAGERQERALPRRPHESGHLRSLRELG